MRATKSVASELLKNGFQLVGGVIREEQGNAALLAEELLIKDEKDIWKIVQPDRERRIKEQQQFLDSARRQIQAVIARVLVTEQPLSRRIWRSEALSRGQLNRAINVGIARGDSAADIAKEIRQFVNPDVKGGASYRATTLARTEINNAFHAQSMADAMSRPWIDQVAWNLSKSHGEQGCLCEEYARIRLFPADGVPKKPHPNCLCTIVPELPDLDTALKNYMSGQYGEWVPSGARM